MIGGASSEQSVGVSDVHFLRRLCSEAVSSSAPQLPQPPGQPMSPPTRGLYLGQSLNRLADVQSTGIILGRRSEHRQPRMH